MKTKIFIASLLILLSLLYLKSKNAVSDAGESSQVFNPGKKFLITAMHSGFDPSNNCNTDFNSYSLFDTLGFNAWHRYGCWFNNDAVFGDSSVIAAGISTTLNENSSHNMRTIFDRPIMRYLAYGQRSDYQCERISEGEDYYFYSYDSSVVNTYVSDITDYSFNGNGAKVKYCGLNAGGPGVWSGYIVKKLRSNREQCNRIIDHTRDDTYNWYVKPRIRIDTAFANNPSNFDIKICRIDIFDWNGDTVKKVELRARSFRANSSTRYEGNYLDEFIYSTTDSNLILQPTQLCPSPIKDAFDWGVPIYVDFRVYWYGNCDMWIDYIRVENQPANQLFDDNNISHDYLMGRLTSEINLAASDFNPADPVPNNFYNEEFEFNMTPCTQKLSNIIDSVSGGKLTLMVNLNMEMYNLHIPRFWENHVFTATEFKKYLLDNSKIKIILPNPYYLEGWGLDSGSGREPSYNPVSLPVYSAFPGIGYDSTIGLLTYPLSQSNYDNWLQYSLDDRNIAYGFTKLLKKFDELSRISNADIIDIHQSHMWNQYNHKLKEPTNEELEMTANLALTYGSKGFMYFAYNGMCTGNGYNTTYTPSGYPLAYSAGFTDRNKNVRDTNAYGQNKWDFYKRYNRLLKTWEPYIMSFDTTRSSYIVRSERDNLINETFISDAYSYRPIESDYPAHQINPETVSQRYFQFAKFNNPDEHYVRYFMIVNRRCSPFYESDPEIESGIRFIKIILDSNSSSFPGFNNWSIYDLGSDSLIKKFDKRIYNTVDLGWYLPGEGKLYKLAPVMQEGGEFVADESVTASEFDCNADVYSENKNITVNPGVTVNFADTVKWEFKGGNITIGETGDNISPVTLRNKTVNSWKGISLENCASVNVFRTTFSGLKNNSTAIELLDNYEYNISNNTFNLTDLDSVSAIEVDYVMPSDTLQSAGCGDNCEEDYIYVNGFVNENTINTTSSIFPSIRCFAYGQYTVALMMNRNVFNSISGTIAVLLSNTSAGNVKNNKIYNYKSGICIYSHASYCDLYHNDISEDSIGVQIFNSVINLGMQDYTYTGGFNLISSSTNNIRTDEGYFSLSDGFNTFNINHQTKPHLEGTFDSENSLDEYAGYNCFKTFSSAGNGPRENVTCMELNCDVTFLFDQICAIEQTEDYLVIDVLGDGSLYDTIWIEGGGSGSGKSDEFQVTSYEFKSSQNKNEYISNMETSSLSDLYNVICIEMRKRNFGLVHTKCLELLNNYPDSSESRDAASKLYLSDLVFDSSGNRLNTLKSYFETLILNNGSNESLVRQLFYLIQKCKVALGQYQSAMNGFQQIMEQNPYNYLGLVASWDYAAASLLNSIHGSAGGVSENGYEDYKLQITNGKLQLEDDPNAKYDRNIFTNGDRKLINESVIKSYETSKEKETMRLKYLEEKINEGKANENEKNELLEKRVLSEVIRVKNPVDVQEHIKFVNNNIMKLFTRKEINSAERMI